QTAEAMKAMAVHDGSLFEETYNLLNAWLAIVPGNGAHNLRRLALLETNLADLSFLFTLDHGDPVSPHLRREALATFETPHRTPYAFNLHVQDVGHTRASASGSAKEARCLTLHYADLDEEHGRRPGRRRRNGVASRMRRPVLHRVRRVSGSRWLRLPWAALREWRRCRGSRGAKTRSCPHVWLH